MSRLANQLANHLAARRSLAVEDCFILDLRKLATLGVGSASPAEGWVGTTDHRVSLELLWSPGVGLVLSGVVSVGTVQVVGDQVVADGAIADHLQPLECTVQLGSSRPHFGGEQRWLVCPAPRCGRLAGRLYLPPGQSRLACRRCWRLGYRTAQKPNRRLDRVLGDPRVGAAILDGIPPGMPSADWVALMLRLIERKGWQKHRGDA